MSSCDQCISPFRRASGRWVSDSIHQSSAVGGDGFDPEHQQSLSNVNGLQPGLFVEWRSYSEHGRSNPSNAVDVPSVARFILLPASTVA